MSQCKAYAQKKINPDLWLNVIPVNCGNCLLWSGERCRDEIVALNMNDPELVKDAAWCQF